MMLLANTMNVVSRDGSIVDLFDNQQQHITKLIFTKTKVIETMIATTEILHEIFIETSKTVSIRKN